MSTKVAVILILVSAAVAGGSAAVALKPAAKPQQAAQLQQAPPKPQQVIGVVPSGPGVPPALAGRSWVGAGGSLGPYAGNWIIPNPPGAPYGQRSMVTPGPPIASAPADQIFPTMPATSTIWYVPDQNPTGPVYFSVAGP